MKISAPRLASSAVAQDLFAQITGVSGSSVTLSIAPAQTGSFTMRHDDSVPINAAIQFDLLAHGDRRHRRRNRRVSRDLRLSARPVAQSLRMLGRHALADRRAERRRRTSGRTRMARRDRRHRHQYEQGGRLASRGAVGLGHQRQHGRRDNRRGQLRDRRRWRRPRDPARYFRAAGPWPRGHRHSRRESIRRQRPEPEFSRRADLESIERAGWHVGLLLRRRRPDLQRGNPRRPDPGPRRRDHVGLRRPARDLRHRLRAEQDRGVDQSIASAAAPTAT